MLEIRLPERVEKYAGAQGKPYATFADASDSLILDAFCVWYEGHKPPAARECGRYPDSGDLALWLLRHRNTIQQFYRVTEDGNCGVTAAP